MRRADSTFRFAETFDALEDRERLRVMTTAHMRLQCKQYLPQTDHMRYVADVCALARRVTDDRELTTARDVWFAYPDEKMQCNCIWHEVVVRACDLARRVLAESLIEPVSQADARDKLLAITRAIGVMTFVRDDALLEWSDRPDEIVDAYSPSTVAMLTEALRAFAHWVYAQHHDEGHVLRTQSLYGCHVLLEQLPATISLQPRDGVGDKKWPTELKNLSAGFVVDFTKVGMPQRRQVLLGDDTKLDKPTWTELAHAAFLVDMGVVFEYEGRDNDALACYNCAEQHGVRAPNASALRDHTIMGSFEAAVQRVSDELLEQPTKFRCGETPLKHRFI